MTSDRIADDTYEDVCEDDDLDVDYSDDTGDDDLQARVAAEDAVVRYEAWLDQIGGAA